MAESRGKMMLRLAIERNTPDDSTLNTEANSTAGGHTFVGPDYFSENSDVELKELLTVEVGEEQGEKVTVMIINETRLYIVINNIVRPDIITEDDVMLTDDVRPDIMSIDDIIPIDDIVRPYDHIIPIDDNISLGRPVKGRKRKGQNNRMQRKAKLNTNQPYTNYKGNIMQPKTFDANFNCKCKQMCTDRVSENIREKGFKMFHNLASYNIRCCFIIANVSEQPTKRKYGESKPKRVNTRIYAIEKQTVCKQTFLKTFTLSPSTITIALKKGRKSNIIDKRGQSQAGWNKITQSRLKEIISHISKFPTYKSHYCRTSTDVQFLCADLTLQKMYDLYNEEVLNPVSLSKYKNIFYSKFNLRFKNCRKILVNFVMDLKPKKEASPTEEEINSIQDQHYQHLLLAVSSRKQMENDLINAKENEEIETLTFDLEKTLPLPRIPTSIVFYLRQVWVYNLGIHSGKTDKGFFNIWVEGEVGHGAQEVASCLRKYILHKTDNISQLILWSDSCGGQNRNIKIVLILMRILKEHPTLKSIQIRFLVSGHLFKK